MPPITAITVRKRNRLGMTGPWTGELTSEIIAPDYQHVRHAVASAPARTLATASAGVVWVARSAAGPAAIEPDDARDRHTGQHQRNPGGRDRGGTGNAVCRAG